MILSPLPFHLFCKDGKKNVGSLYLRPLTLILFCLKQPPVAVLCPSQNGDSQHRTIQTLSSFPKPLKSFHPCIFSPPLKLSKNSMCFLSIVFNFFPLHKLLEDKNYVLHILCLLQHDQITILLIPYLHLKAAVPSFVLRIPWSINSPRHRERLWHVSVMFGKFNRTTLYSEH